MNIKNTIKTWSGYTLTLMALWFVSAATARGQSCSACTGYTLNGGAAAGSSSGSSNDGSGGDGTSCQTCPPSTPGTGGNSGAGSSGNNLGSTVVANGGMPRWEVSEPYISVWVYDEPLGYQPGLGTRVSFKLAYKQREERATNADFFSIGMMWDCQWLSYISDDTNNNVATMVVPGGGARTYTPDNSTREYFTHTLLERTTNGSGGLTGFILHYADGANDYYQFVPSSHTIDMHKVALLTAKVDPYGHTNSFQYAESGAGVTLNSATDADGQTTMVSYANPSFPLFITSVQDPFGRTATLKYDSTGMLTNVTDVANLSSSFKYDSQGWITNLITPYGTTTFEHITNSDGFNTLTFDPSDYTLIRAVKVVNPVGGTNIYMLRQDSSEIYTNIADYNAGNSNYLPFMPDSTNAGVIPANPPYTFGFLTGLDLENTLEYRNSFHWGPRQASGLPVDLFTFAPANFKTARMRHWLHDFQTGLSISQVLDFEQDPSPDGIKDGQTTWINYLGISDPQGASSDCLPAIISRVLPDGTTSYIEYVRDEWGRPTNILTSYSSNYGATALNRTNIILIYAANNIDLAQVIGINGETNAAFGYNANHQVTSVTNAVGDVTTYTYDLQGRLTNTLTPAGLNIANIYYPTGPYSNWVQMRIAKEINRTNSFSYTNDLVYLHTNALGMISTNLYDNLQRLTNRADARGAVAYVYDKLDLVKVVDRLGFTNIFVYDPERRLVATTNALGNYTLYDYCACGALDSIQDALGNVTSFNYNKAGWLTNIVYPDLTSLTNFYDLTGRVTNTMDSAGRSVTNWFNNQGLLYAVSNYFGRVKYLTFDIEDRLTNSVDANGVVITNLYDNLGRLLTRTYPDGGVEAFAYTNGMLRIYTNQLGQTNAYGYDAAMRKTSETNANKEVTQYTYDAAGDLLTLKDGKSDTTTWHYSLFGLVTNKVDAAGTIILTNAYDANNRLTKRWSAAKGNTTYAYDAVGNLTGITYPVSPAITLSYDALNRLTNMVDAVGTTIYGYDSVGQLLSEDGPWGNDTVSYSYNNRLRTGLSLQQPNADPWGQSYSYDGARRLTNTVSPAGSFGYTYDPTDQLQVQKLTLPNTAYITNTYDSVARLLTTKLKNSGNTNLDAYTYTYNVGNQRTTVTRTLGDAVAYAYDAIGQLTNATGTESGGVTNRWQEQWGYGYDAAHNLSARTNYTSVETFSVNSLNELTGISQSGRQVVAGTVSTLTPAVNVTVNASVLGAGPATVYNDGTWVRTNVPVVANDSITATGTDGAGRTASNHVSFALSTSASYTYDANGNLLGDGSRSFAYDDENQLTTAYVTNVWMSQFVYDGKLRRRVRKEFTWSGSAWVQTNEVRYVYDGNVVIQERDGNNLPVTTYTRGNDLSGTLQGAGGIGGLLAMSINGVVSPQHYYYHADGNGNVTALINGLQFIAAKYLYDSFGNVVSLSGPMANVNLYRFSSKETHINSGLVYYLYRYYDVNLQRWPNRDPLGERWGNLYGFTANDPIRRMDINGYTWVTYPNTQNPGTFPTVVCKGGKPTPAVPPAFDSGDLASLSGNTADQQLCIRKCQYAHEQSHVKDILAQNPNICQGVADGTPVVNNDPNELLNSEQKAHQVEAGCLNGCAKTCPGAEVADRQKKNDQWIKDHQYE